MIVSQPELTYSVTTLAKKRSEINCSSQEWLYRWDNFFLHAIRLAILYGNFDMAPILKWREKECVMCTEAFKQYNIRLAHL